MRGFAIWMVMQGRTRGWGRVGAAYSSGRGAPPSADRRGPGQTPPPRASGPKIFTREGARKNLGISEQENPLLAFIERYGPPAGDFGPERMAEEIFGFKLDPWQIEVCRDFARGERRISIAACHGPGKTFVASILVVNHLLCRFPQKTVATAPSKNQLENALVAEVITRFRSLPPVLQDLFEVKKNRIELKMAPEESFFTASTARAESPEALQGVHSEHVFLLADEASGVPEQIFQSAQGSMSGHNATTLLLSNPTRGSGYFFDTFHRAKEQWKCYRISAFDSSRVSDKYVQGIANAYGEDSNVYRIRVLGLFPKADDDTVIPLYLVESARNRDIVPRKGTERVWGLDVARFGDDTTALVIRDSMRVLPEISTWKHADLMQTSGRVKALWDETPYEERPTWILVDSIGLGGGVVDRLRELALPVRGVNVSEAASVSEKYINLRAELWFKAREWLSSLDHTLPTCEGGCARDCVHNLLQSELTAPRFEYTSSGKIKVESKAEMKARGLKSPDVADAFVLTFAAEPAGLIHGRDRKWGARSWNEPVRRGRAMV